MVVLKGGITKKAGALSKLIDKCVEIGRSVEETDAPATVLRQAAALVDSLQAELLLSKEAPRTWTARVAEQYEGSVETLTRNAVLSSILKHAETSQYNALVAMLPQQLKRMQDVVRVLEDKINRSINNVSCPPTPPSRENPRLVIHDQGGDDHGYDDISVRASSRRGPTSGSGESVAVNHKNPFLMYDDDGFETGYGRTWKDTRGQKNGEVEWEELRGKSRGADRNPQGDREFFSNHEGIPFGNWRLERHGKQGRVGRDEKGFRNPLGYGTRGERFGDEESGRFPEFQSRVEERKIENSDQISGNRANFLFRKINIPSFSGDNGKISFSDFLQLIYTNIGASNGRLSGTEKLLYLKQHLEGEALRVVQALPLSDRGWVEAQSRLEARYGRGRKACKVSKVFWDVVPASHSEKHLLEYIDKLRSLYDEMSINLHGDLSGETGVGATVETLLQNGISAKLPLEVIKELKKEFRRNGYGETVSMESWWPVVIKVIQEWSCEREMEQFAQPSRDTQRSSVRVDLGLAGMEDVSFGNYNTPQNNTQMSNPFATGETRYDKRIGHGFKGNMGFGDDGMVNRRKDQIRPKSFVCDFCCSKGRPALHRFLNCPLSFEQKLEVAREFGWCLSCKRNHPGECPNPLMCLCGETHHFSLCREYYYRSRIRDQQAGSTWNNRNGVGYQSRYTQPAPGATWQQVLTSSGGQTGQPSQSNQVTSNASSVIQGAASNGQPFRM